MEKPTKAVLAAASIGVAVIILNIIGVRVGITAGGSLSDRLAYPFCHANIFHAMGNAYCLFLVTKSYRMSIAALLTAYAIAVAVPAFVLSTTPTVGLSGMCFALIGLPFWRVRRKLYYNAWAVGFIAITSIFNHIAAALHLWCLFMGEAVGFLNAPVPWRRK